MPNETVYGGKDKIILANKSDREEWKKDARFITKSGVHKNNLFLTITYSGGCKEHNFELIAWNLL